jgi:hypothetical protein
VTLPAEAVVAAATGAVAREHDRKLLTELGRSRGAGLS